MRQSLHGRVMATEAGRRATGEQRRVMKRWRMALAVAIILSPTIWCCNRSLGAVDPATVIRAALEHWRDDFNARRANTICDLFARDLRYDFQGLPEQNYTQLCGRLHRALADRTQSYHYDLRVKEIIVSGDLAMVRLTWISTFTGKDGKREIEDEPGLDVFQRSTNGEWKITRYIAYPEAPR
jgi:ketosteroid isomerase-like protein